MYEYMSIVHRDTNWYNVGFAFGIGKPKDEGRGMSEDGQYFHYLTKWMFALHTLHRVTQDHKYNDWAVDLVKTVHPHFVKDVPGVGKRMFWKLSIDLQRPLVPSEGGLDSYDGFAMYRLIQENATNPSILSEEIADMKELVDRRFHRYSTDDCLDAGEALWLSHFYPGEPWSEKLRETAGKAVSRLWNSGEFSDKKIRRLAFREFGTSIGVQMHKELWEREGWKGRVGELHDFWRESIYDRDCDITPVMYATSLLPGWFCKEYPN